LPQYPELEFQNYTPASSAEIFDMILDETMIDHMIENPVLIETTELQPNYSQPLLEDSQGGGMMNLPILSPLMVLNTNIPKETISKISVTYKGRKKIFNVPPTTFGTFSEDVLRHFGVSQPSNEFHFEDPDGSVWLSSSPIPNWVTELRLRGKIERKKTTTPRRRRTKKTNLPTSS